VLSALDDKIRELVLSEHNQRVPIEEVSRDWFGDFTIVWKPKTSRTRELSVGMHGDEVRWLRRSLAALHGASFGSVSTATSTTRNSPSRCRMFSASIASTWTASPACKPKSYSTPPWRNQARRCCCRPYRTARNIHVIHSRRPQEIRARTATPERSGLGIPVWRGRARIAAWAIALGLLLAVICWSCYSY